MSVEGLAAASRDVVVDLFGDADRDVRLHAVLEAGWARDEAAAPALVERFGLEREFQIREALTWACLRTRRTSLPLVLDALRSPRWLARLQAVHTVSKLGRFQDGPAVLPLVRDPVDAVSARAYWAAAQTRNPVTVPALVAELARGDSEHRNSLTAALVAFGTGAVHAARPRRSATPRRPCPEAIRGMGPHRAPAQHLQQRRTSRRARGRLGGVALTRGQPLT
jgi:HEAT repeat protein